MQPSEGFLLFFHNLSKKLPITLFETFQTMGPKVEKSAVLEPPKCEEPRVSLPLPVTLLPAEAQRFSFFRLDDYQSRASLSVVARPFLDFRSEGPLGGGLGAAFRLAVTFNRYSEGFFELGLAPVFTPQNGSETSLQFSLPTNYRGGFNLFPLGHDKGLHVLLGVGGASNLLTESWSSYWAEGGLGYRFLLPNQHHLDLAVEGRYIFAGTGALSFSLPDGGLSLSLIYSLFESEHRGRPTPLPAQTRERPCAPSVPAEPEPSSGPPSPEPATETPRVEVKRAAAPVIQKTEDEKRREEFLAFVAEKETEIARLKKALPEGITGSTEMDLLERTLEEFRFKLDFYRTLAAQQKGTLFPTLVLGNFFDALQLEVRKDLAQELGLLPSEVGVQIREEREWLTNPDVQRRLVERKKVLEGLILTELRNKNRTVYRETRGEQVVFYKLNEYGQLYHTAVAGELIRWHERSTHLAFMIDRNRPRPLYDRIRDQPWIQRLHRLSATHPAERGDYVVKNDDSHRPFWQSALMIGVVFIPRVGHPVGLALTALEVMRVYFEDKDLFGNSVDARGRFETNFNGAMTALYQIPRVGKPLAALLAFAEFSSVMQKGIDLAGNKVDDSAKAISAIVAMLSTLIALKGDSARTPQFLKDLERQMKLAQEVYSANPKRAQELIGKQIANALKGLSDEDAALLRGFLTLSGQSALLDPRMIDKLEQAAEPIFKAQRRKARSRGSDDPPIDLDGGRRVDFYRNYALRSRDPLKGAREEGIPRSQEPSGGVARFRGARPFQAGQYRALPTEEAIYFRAIEKEGFGSLVSAEARASLPEKELARLDQTLVLLEQRSLKGQAQFPRGAEKHQGGMANVHIGRFIPDEGEPFEVAAKFYRENDMHLLKTLPSCREDRACSALSLMYEEPRNLIEFGEKGIGPGYVGMIKSGKGRVGIIMRKAEGVHEDELDYQVAYEAISRQMPGASLEVIHQKVGEVYASLAAQYRQQFRAMVHDVRRRFTDPQALNDLNIQNPRVTFIDLPWAERVIPGTEARLDAANEAWIAAFETQKYGREIWKGSKLYTSYMGKNHWAPDPRSDPKELGVRFRFSEPQRARVVAVSEELERSRLADPLSANNGSYRIIFMKDELGNVSLVTLNPTSTGVDRKVITINPDGAIISK